MSKDFFSLSKRVEGTFKNEGIPGVIRRLVPPVYVTSSDIRIIQRNKVTRNQLMRSNREVLSNVDRKVTFNASNTSNIIWFSWLQGMNRAPSVVQLCYSRLKVIYPHKKIIIITEDNYTDYVRLPNFILSKIRDGYISRTHFSDILRLELLIKYGGSWLDSTVYCERPASYVCFESPLFFLSSYLRNDSSVAGSNWFITSAPQNPVLILTRKLLYNFWRKHKHISNYFIFHICFKISLEAYPLIASNVPLVSNVPSHLLVEYLNKKYDYQTVSLVLNQSAFHKLSNKVVLNGDETSVYAHLENEVSSID